MPVEFGGHFSTFEVIAEVVHENVDSEMCDGASLGGGQRSGVAKHKNVVVGKRLHGVVVAGDVVVLVSKGGAGDEFCAHVHRHGHQHVEGDFAAVVSGDDFPRRVDALDVEVGLEFNLAGPSSLRAARMPLVW